MNRTTAWIDGRFVPVGELALPADDLLVTSAAAVCETARTFRHRPFLLAEHLDRLARSARDARVPLRESPEAIAAIVDDLLAKNAEELAPRDDAVISIVASPGRGGALGLGPESSPTLAITLTPISSRNYGPIHEAGFHLAVPPVAALPVATLPRSLKTRSRLHWHVADRLAAERHPGAVAVLADADGALTETNLGNLFLVRSGELVTPPAERVLPGISRAYVIELAEELGVSVTEADISPDDLRGADEAFVTSSVICLAPVTRFEGRAVASGGRGPVTSRLLGAWSDRVGADIATQLSADA